MRTKKNSTHEKFKTTGGLDEIETYLVDLEKSTAEELEFWEEYWSYFSREREKRLDDISDALNAGKIHDGEFKKCSRIVAAKFANDPLCTVGSTKISSNRFNFGSISQSLVSFQALYVGEDFNTAYLEKYGYEYGTRMGLTGYDPSVLKAQPGGFSHFELDVEIETYLDLRSIDKLQPFVDVLREIKIPQAYINRSRKLFGRDIGLNTTTNVVKLKRALLHREQAQWPTLLDMPSNSQWFGYYAKQAGISGIVYPSVKSKYGFNIAPFTENFDDSSSNVKLTEKWPTVPADRHALDSSNFKIMMFGLENQLSN